MDTTDLKRLDFLLRYLTATPDETGDPEIELVAPPVVNDNQLAKEDEGENTMLHTQVDSLQVELAKANKELAKQGEDLARKTNELALAREEISRLKQILLGMGYFKKEEKSNFSLLEVD